MYPCQVAMNTESKTPIALPHLGIEVISDIGQGRVFIIIVDDLNYIALAHEIALQLSQRARVVTLLSAAVTATSWEPLSEILSELVVKLAIRQASLVGLGAGATLAQNLVLVNPKLVRTLAVIDSSSRPHPSRWERLVDRIEGKLPFGLPLRLGLQGFNVKSYLHRLRCPLLVIGTQRASSFILSELQSLASLAPTAWQVTVSDKDSQTEAAALTATILAFQDTPAKCPQKNI